MKVIITSSVSQRLRGKRIEIDQEFCDSRSIKEFKEGSVDVETPTAYMIIPKSSTQSYGYWVEKDDVEILPEVTSTLDRWV